MMETHVVGEGMTEAESRALFRDPTHAFRPSAYWFWHSIPDAQTSRAQLTDFRDQGFGTILIQTRIAFPREFYLSDAYLAAYRQAIKIAGELGLKAGIYDDYNWISGHAGGRTVEGRDGLRERHLFWSTTETSIGDITGIHAPFANSMGPEILRWHYEDGRLRWCEWTIEAALLHPFVAISDVHQAIDITARVRITDADAQSCSFIFDGSIPPEYVITVFVSVRSSTSRLINYLLPEAAERFIEVGLDPYRKVLDGLMPNPVGFVFYDQPAAGFYRWDQHEGNLGNSLLFTDTLVAVAAQKANAAFPHILLSLLRDVGTETGRLRAQFYGAYSDLMNASFFGTLRKWAEETGIVLTGHEILPHISAWSLNGGFTSIDPRVAPATDFFGIDSFRHETAVDSNNFVAQLAPKMGDSVARSNGRSRCVVETYASATRTPVRAAGQWELTLETMRAQAIRLHCLGTRQFLWHGVYQTDGHDDDPTPFANPRFDYGPGINFEPWWPYHHLFAQESARISAFIEPARLHARVAILYPLHTAWAEGPRHSHATHLGAWCEHLLALGCDFMLVDEHDLSNAFIEGRMIELVGLAFDAVVLPSVTVLNSVDTLQKLADFRAAGGLIWASGDDLATICNGALDGPANIWTAHLRDLPTREDIAELVAQLPLIGPQIVAPAAQFLWRWVGQDADGGWRVVLFNDGTQSLQCSVTHGDGFDCEVWSVTHGVVDPIGTFGRLSIDLEPQQAKCLRLRETSGQAMVDKEITSLPLMDISRAIALEEDWTFAAGSDNDFAPISVHSGWEAQGRPGFSGTGIYRHSLEIPSDDEWMLELGEVHTAVTVRLNGHEIGQRGWQPYRFQLGRLLPGRYELELAVSNTAANRYYAGTPFQGETLDKSGLTTPPRIIPLANKH